MTEPTIKVTLKPNTDKGRFWAGTQNGWNCYVSVPRLGLLIFEAHNERGLETGTRAYLEAFRDALTEALEENSPH